MTNINVGETSKINVSEVEGNIDYEGTMKEFGIEKIDKELKKLKELPLM